MIEKAKTFYFMVVAVMMYYFLNEYIDIGLHVTYRHAFALVLAFSAILLFLYKPDIARGVTAFKDASVYSIPLLVTTVVSLFIWFVGTVDVGVISRGLSSSFVYTNMLSFALGAGAMLYIFGSKGIWYNCQHSYDSYGYCTEWPGKLYVGICNAYRYICGRNR